MGQAAHRPWGPHGARARERFYFFGFFDFWDPAPVLGVLDIELLIPEVWDFYLFSGATFFSVISPSKII